MKNKEELLLSLYRYGLLKHAGSANDLRVVSALFPDIGAKISKQAKDEAVNDDNVNNDKQAQSNEAKGLENKQKSNSIPPDIDMGEYHKVRDAILELVNTDPKVKSELKKLVNSQKTFKAKVEELLSKQDFGEGLGKAPTLSDAGYEKLLQEVFHVQPAKEEADKKDKDASSKKKPVDKKGPEGNEEAPGAGGPEVGGLGDLDALLGL